MTAETQRVHFRTMWWVATLVLIGVTVLFFVASHFRAVHPGFALLRAFCEAAMVGGLADWFAVSALFRRPLGLPIPHTAIVPANKGRIGRSLGLFIHENFLSEEVLESEAVNITGAITRWLEVPENRRSIVQSVQTLMPHLLETLEEEEIKQFFDSQAEDLVSQLDLAGFTAKILRLLTVDELHEVVLDEVVLQSRSFFHDNSDWFQQQIRDASPWFVPEFVDRRIFAAILEKTEETLSSAIADRNHELRRRVHAAVEQFIAKLETSDKFKQEGEKIKQLLLKNTVVREYINSIRDGILENVREDVLKPDSKILAALENMLEGFVETMSGSSDLQLRMNRILRRLFAAAVGDQGEHLVERIAKTVDSWDTDTLVQKLEEQVGSDLQFIRMNGTIVGGLIGVAIFTVENLLH